MSAIFRRVTVGACMSVLVTTAANAGPIQLPIKEGIWIKTDTPCKAAYCICPRKWAVWQRLFLRSKSNDGARE